MQEWYKRETELYQTDKEQRKMIEELRQKIAHRRMRKVSKKAKGKSKGIRLIDAKKSK